MSAVARELGLNRVTCYVWALKAGKVYCAAVLDVFTGYPVRGRRLRAVIW